MAAPAAHAPSPPATAARLAAEDLPPITVGDAGCLVAAWLDGERLDFLDLLAGDRPAALAWGRDGGLLRLDWRPLGVEVAAGDPSRLMDALEHLSDRADALLPQAQAAVEHAVAARRATAEDPDALRRELARRLRADLAAARPGRPPGARFRAAALVTPPSPGRTADPLARPEVEDHRAIIPPRPGPRRP